MVDSESVNGSYAALPDSNETKNALRRQLSRSRSWVFESFFCVELTLYGLIDHCRLARRRQCLSHRHNCKVGDSMTNVLRTRLTVVRSFVR
jgi:hypothetical protein